MEVSGERGWYQILRKKKLFFGAIFRNFKFFNNRLEDLFEKSDMKMENGNNRQISVILDQILTVSENE